MGQEPALPRMDSGDTSGPMAPWREESMATWESWVGEMDGGERDFFLVDAPARSFSSPLFFSFWRDTKVETKWVNASQKNTILFRTLKIFLQSWSEEENKAETEALFPFLS
jgi:hypothetical protein